MTTSSSSKEVLVYLGESRRAVCFRRSETAAAERKAFVAGVASAFEDIFGGDEELPSSSSLLVQVKSEEWGGEFVDLMSDASIPDRSILRVVVGKCKGKDVASKGANISKALGKPSSAEKLILGSLFPSSSGVKREAPLFDPLADLSQHKKKKPSTKVTLRPFTREVVLLHQYRGTVPRNKVRQDLQRQKRIQPLKFKRSMSALEVKNVICRGFQHIDGFSSFHYLECIQNNRLAVVASQHVDGEFVSTKKGGSLYLCEVCEEDVVEVSVGEDDEQSTQQGAANAGAGGDSDMEDLESSGVQQQQQHVDPTITEWRQLRLQQDQEYQQSLIIDRTKDADAIKESARKERIESLKVRLREKLALSSHSGKTISFRMPDDGAKLEGTFTPDDKPKVLYEFVFCNSEICCAFGIYTTFPRVLVDVEGVYPIENLDNSLAIEMDDNMPDPLISLEFSDVEGEDETSAALRTAAILKQAEEERVAFVQTLSLKRGMTHMVNRENIFESVTALYRDKREQIMGEYPLRVRFLNEKAIDVGGVSRDMFAAFYDQAYIKVFDGNNLLTPVIHPHLDLSSLVAVGTIFSHAYVVCGMLPVRIAFPSLVCCLMGTGNSTSIPDPVFIEAFVDSLSGHDSAIFKEAFAEIKAGKTTFSTTVQSALLSTMSGYGCREVPKPTNLKTMILQASTYTFIIQPTAALVAIHSGVPQQHLSFWRDLGVMGLYSIYGAQSVSPAKVLKMFEDAVGTDANEERILGYLRQYVGSMSTDELRQFLRFVTGSSVCLSCQIQVTFNNLEGIARRPIAHTCQPSLELSLSYMTSPEFTAEFRAILSDQYAWIMDSF